TVDVAVTYGQQRVVTLSGHVTDADNAGLSITFSGRVTGTAVTDANGFFTFTAVANGLGGVSVSTGDRGGLASNTATVTLASAAPQIVSFHAERVAFDMWRITGRVEDECPEGLVITFDGLDSLTGKTATVRADGTFVLEWRLSSMNETGYAIGRTRDWW